MTNLTWGHAPLLEIPIDIQPQPDDTTCGPTCLHAVYRHFGEQLSLDKVIAEVPNLSQGGTLAVFLAIHALRRGYRAKVFTYNLTVFDPTWFTEPGVDMVAKLRRQIEVKDDPKLREASEGYLELLQRGGQLCFEELTPGLIRRFLHRGIPILTGLSATFLYGTAREIDDDFDDIRGLATGHFVVLCGYKPGRREVTVADPLHPNPMSPSHVYSVGMSRLINAILLGVLTYDANLLILEPPDEATPG